MKTMVTALAGAALLAGVSLSSSQASPSGPAVFTSAQALAGAKTYAAQCSRCHGANLQGVSAPALRGSGSGLAGDSISEAFTFISTQMPAGNPGSLSSGEYANVLAYILSRNGHKPGTTPLTPAAAKASHAKI
jgi:polar amino acid transport system substrate-binding protein